MNNLPLRDVMPFPMRAPSFGIKESASDINETLFVVVDTVEYGSFIFVSFTKRKRVNFQSSKKLQSPTSDPVQENSSEILRK